jgi:multiple sugar transport system substrate-binding protein
MIFRYTKYPKAAKEFLRFMMEEEQISPWVTASIGYVTPALTAYEKHPVWNDPKSVPYRDSMKIMLPSGYAGKMGYASAGALSDFIIVNMVAEAVSGDKSPKEAAERAAKRAERYYKV